MFSPIQLIIDKLKHAKKLDILAQGLHGIERETLRVNDDLTISQKDHPTALGDKLTDPFITTDFAESQLELVTAAFETIDQSVDSLRELHKRVIKGLDNEYIWPLSMPAVLPPDKEIIIAKFGSSLAAQEKEMYRKGLALRTGKKSQMISGIHYNFSFSDELWEFLYLDYDQKMTMQEFKNDRLLELKKSLVNWSWLLVYFTGASPTKHSTYKCTRVAAMKNINPISLRMSRCGYRNSVPININYDSFDDYIRSIKVATETSQPQYTALGIYDLDGNQQQMNDHILQIANEYYFPVRIKPKPGAGNYLDGLIERGGEYLELRMIDVDPFYAEGVDRKALKLIHLIIVACFLGLPEIGKSMKMNLNNIKKLEEIAIKAGKGLSVNDKKSAEELLLQLEKLGDYFPTEYREAVTYFKDSLSNNGLLPWGKIKKDTINKDFLSYTKELIKNNLSQFLV